MVTGSSSGGDFLKPSPGRSARERRAHLAAGQDADARTWRETTGVAHEVRPLGRELPLASLIDNFKIALGGVGRTCLVTGEAGVGKTRLMQELLERAEAYDCHILSGKAQEYDHGIANATLRDVLASARYDDFDEQSRTEFASLLERLDAAVLGDGREAGQFQRAQPAYLLTKALTSLCQHRPTVIALDDAHLSDDETLVSLSLAARRLANMPLFMLVSTRLDKWQPGGRFAATVGRIIDSGQGGVVDLGPLDLDDTRALIASDLPGRPDDRLAAYVYSLSRGNPLFTRQALRSLRELGAIRAEHGRCYLMGNPAAGALSRRAALLHRVFQQDRAGRELARAMSAFRRVHLDQVTALEAATGMDRDSIESSFDALIRASIIAPISAGWYEFAHPLIAEVLYNDLGPLERRRLHRLIAESLGTRRLTAEPDILEWTLHVAEAATPGDSAAIAAVIEAARLTRNTAPLSAATWYQRAVDLLPPESPERGELLSRQAIALWKGSRPEAAIEVGGRALAAEGNGDLRTRTLETVINATYAMGRYTDALELLSAHAHHVRSPAPFLAQRALLLAHTGQGELAAVQLDQAEASRDLASAGDQVVTCTYVGHVSNCLGDFARARAAIDRLVALGQGEEPGLAHGARLSALESAAYLLAVTGCLRDARNQLATVTQLLPKTGWQDVGGQYVYAKAKLEHMSGAWAEALETIRSGAISLEFAGLRNNLAWLRLLEVEILTDQASLDEASQLLSEPLLAADCVLYQVLYECRAARITAGLGDVPAARKALLEQLSRAEQCGLAEATRRCLDVLVDVCVAAGDLTTAAQYAARLRELARQTQIPATIAAADLADLAVGKVLDGERLVSEYEEEDRLSSAAQAHLYLASAGLDPERHLGRAHELFTGMDAKLWIPRVLAVAKQIGLNVTTSRRPRGREVGRRPLSDTEVQLVQLLRQGLTNRQISAVMHYSAKTIEVYVSRLYQKVGCRSRLELVLAAERGEIDGLPVREDESARSRQATGSAS